MTVSKEVESEIRVLHFGEHWPIGTISNQLKVHEDVVKRVCGLLEPREPAEPRALLVDPVRDFIKETLDRYPRLVSTRLFDMVKPQPIKHFDRTVKGGFGVMLDDLVAAFMTLLVFAIWRAL